VTVSINQPAYLPWLGYFERIAASDVHIVLDHVQFEKNSFVNRNKVRTREGWTWLTVPVLTKGRFGHLAINQLDLVAGHPWAKKHWSTLRMNYARAPFFPSYAPAYDALYAHPWSGFLPMAEAFLRQHLADLGIRTQILFSSTLGISGTKSDLVLNLCRAVGADRYLSGHWDAATSPRLTLRMPAFNSSIKTSSIQAIHNANPARLNRRWESLI